MQIGCIPFSLTFFGFGQFRLFGFSCLPEQKCEIRLIHTEDACRSDLLLNFIVVIVVYVFLQN